MSALKAVLVRQYVNTNILCWLSELYTHLLFIFHMSCLYLHVMLAFRAVLVKQYANIYR